MTLAKKEWLNKHSDAVSSQRKVMCLAATSIKAFNITEFEIML